jgi:alpha-N-arabinofuranosidase
VYIRGFDGKEVSGRVLCAGAMNAHNTFAQPEAVKPQPFGGARLADGGVELVMPKMAVVALDVA